MIFVHDDEVLAVRQQIQELIVRYPLKSTPQRVVGIAARDETVQLAVDELPQLMTPFNSNEIALPLTGELQPEVVVLPIMPDGSLTFVLRYRFGRAHWSLELPRGVTRRDDQSWRMTAERELLAATGLVAKEFLLLGGLSCDLQGVAASVYVVAARGCESQQAPTWNQQQLIAGSVRVTAGSLDALIRRGDIECSLTLSALPLARLHLADSKRGE